MTELDFDELDKAVNSLMGDGDTPDAAQAKPANASSPDSATNMGTRNANPPVSLPEQSDTQSSAASPLATKRRGQFMDVMHSSSNMKTPTSTAPFKRQPLVVSPVSSPEVSEPVTVGDAIDNSSVDTSLNAGAVPMDIEPATEPKNEWPDPIDLINSSDAKDVQSNDDLLDADEHQVNIAPQESPFLADAKPEKRPLGAPQPADEPLELLEDDSTPSEPSSDTDMSLETPPQPTVSLPAELHDNVIAVEADSTTTTTTETQPEVAEEAPVVVETPVEQKPTEPSSGSGTIQQQYKEEPSTGDQTSGSIYDTANYHKAIEAHASSSKKGSAIKWVIWVLLLLIIGVGAGAAYFMLTR